MTECVQNFSLPEWIMFLLAIAFVLFIMYPKSNGDFDHGYFEEKPKKEKHWWE